MDEWLRRRRHQAVAWFDERVVRVVGLGALVRRTENFSHATWLGRPIWQNLADVWTIQEVIVDRGVDFVVECGTNRGGSALFMASIFDLLGKGRVVTVDVDAKVDFEHPRIEFLHGSSVDPSVVATVRDRIAAAEAREVLVVLDSDHSAQHVLEELRTYADIVPNGGYMIVQDGICDELPSLRPERPGPLVAIRQFLSESSQFEIDEQRSTKYLFHHSPSGCLRRIG